MQTAGHNRLLRTSKLRFPIFLCPVDPTQFKIRSYASVSGRRKSNHLAVSSSEKKGLN